MNYENELCDAIELIVNNAVANANYDRTIQATVIKCIDQTIGKFKCKYQDSTFYAYATSSEVTYSQGTEVYILIPGNDSSRDKTILGTTKKLGADYAVNPEGEEAFEIIGNNCIFSPDVFELCSYKTQQILLYEYGNNNNHIEIDQRGIQEYIRKSSYILCGGVFKTALPNEQQFRGNYGIIFEVKFLDNATGESIIKNYVVDVNQMDGNPYKITKNTRQYGIFEIDGKNFQYINKVYLFCYDFPNQNDSNLGDIFIRDIELSGCTKMTEDELNSCALSFITPQGIYFDNTDLESSTRTIQAQVRVKGKVVDKDSQNLDYYWFVENAGVNIRSEGYCKYGGQGWKCLNSYSVIRPAENNTEAIVEWVSGDSERVVKKYPDSLAKETKYKCVVIYNETTILSKEISIINYSSDYDITIDSDSGTKFYYDIGNPTLTCKINGTEQKDFHYNYQWAYIDNNNNFNSLAETYNENSEFNNAVINLQDLQYKIKTELMMAEASKTKINEYNNIIKKYDTITRIEKNKIFKIGVNTITNFATYKVSVYRDGAYIGTASIILTNSLEAEDMYHIVINNGSQVFKYNESGVSPTSDILEKPMILNPLSFSVYDNLGQKIDDNIIEKCDIKWIIPKKDTLLKIPSSYDEYKINENENEIIYNKLMEISYTIGDRYNLKYPNNNIQLQVNYKGMNLITKTNFSFTKEGEPGTNGTDFVCKIVPNSKDEKTPLYPMITFNESGNNFFLNYSTGDNIWFKVQLWHNGEKIYEGNMSGFTSEGRYMEIKWSVLANKYGYNNEDETNFTIDPTNGYINYNSYNFDNPANIIKCTVKYDNLEYYSTMPIITARIKNDDYRIELEDYCGFRYAVYSADGRTPQYDNSKPFELKVTQRINNVVENISRLNESYAVDYNWITRGRYYDTEWRYNNGLSIQNTNNLFRNQKNIKPIDEFNGYCVSNAIECIVTRYGEFLAKIHIPIHMLLNKFGHAAINSWDGNHVYLNDNGDGVILAPQVGAGKKNERNEFTGVLIGEIKEVGKAQSNTGLFGYNAGARTIFLNSESGSAIFGNNNGQIIIDPNSNRAMLYSRNYWKNYNNSGGAYDGLPISYNQSNENNQGMLIDLTTPSIKFGSGKFEVNSDGYLRAVDVNVSGTIVAKSGSIGGYTIEEHTLIGWNGNQTVGMSSNPSYGWAFWAGAEDSGQAPFHVGHHGELYATDAHVTGEIEAKWGHIGGYNIGEYNLIGWNGNQTVGMSSSINHGPAFWAGAEDGWQAPFRVAQDGVFVATEANITGGITAKWGTIGGYNISEHNLIRWNGNQTVGISSDINYGPAFWAGGDNGWEAPFRVSQDGGIVATNAYIEGGISAQWGTIGGYTISEYTLIGWNGDQTVGMSSMPNYGWAFWAGAEDSGQAPFRVGHHGELYATDAHITGNITATSGKIGGLYIDGDILSFTNSAGNTTIFGNGTTGVQDSIVIRTADGQYPFVVRATGEIFATNAHITGEITATSGSFTGTVTATSGSFTGTITAANGTIGGYTINEHALVRFNGNRTVGMSSQEGWGWAFWAGAEDSGQAPFRVGHDGALFATNANIEGTVTATSGVFKNCTVTDSCTVPASTITGTLATSKIPNLNASKITSGTLSGINISGGQINGSTIKALTVGADTIGLNTNDGVYTVGDYEGKTTNITVPISLTVVDGKITGQTWRRLRFRGGILVGVDSNW